MVGLEETWRHSHPTSVEHACSNELQNLRPAALQQFPRTDDAREMSHRLDRGYNRHLLNRARRSSVPAWRRL